MRKVLALASLFLSICILKAQPSNDLCPGAISLTVMSGSCGTTTFFDNSLATDSGVASGNASCDFLYDGGDGWYEFVAPLSGRIKFEVTNSSTNFMSELYEGSCSSLSYLQCLTADFADGLVPGNSYYLRIWSYYNAIGTIDFCLLDLPDPPNDDCSNALSVAVGSNQTCGTVIDEFYVAGNSGFGDPSCQTSVQSDLWYSFVSPSSGSVLIERYAGDRVVVYEGASCGGLTEIACSFASQIPINGMNGGNTYYIRIVSTSSTISANFCIQELADPAINDDCASALNIPIGSSSCGSTIVSNFYNATDSGIIPTCLSISNDDIWFSFVAPSIEAVDLEILNNTGSSTRFVLYAGTCGGLSEEFCNAGNLTTGVYPLTGLTSGQTYFLRFINYGSPGVLSLCAKEGSPPPVNDNCSGALSVVVGNGSCGPTITANNIGATLSNIASSCGYDTTPDIWYKFDAPVNGSVNFDVISIVNGNVRYTIYENACGSLNEIGCDNASTYSIVQFPGLTPSQTYYLRLSLDYPIVGDIEFCLEEGPSAPSNDDCVGATAISIGPIISGSSEGASASSEIEPTCGFYYNSGDVWYSFVPTISSMKLTHSSGGATGYAIFGGTCGSLTQVQCHYIGAIGTRHINGLIPSNTYYVRVWKTGYGSYGTFDFKLENNSGPIPSNDDCVNSTTLPMSLAGHDFDPDFNRASGSSEIDPTCANYNGGDLWYDFVAPSTGNIAIDYSNLPSEPNSIGAAIYSGSCGSLTEEYCDDISKSPNDGNISGLTPGNSYQLRFWDKNFTYYSPFDVNIKEGTATPPNDVCSNAIALTVASGSCTYTTANNQFASDSGEMTPSCHGNANRDLWYTFTAPAVGSIIYESNVSNIFLGLYTGTCGSFTEVDCRSGGTIENYYGLNPSQVYYLRLWASGGSVFGVVDFCLKEGLPPPPNDDCSNAASLVVQSTCPTSTTGYTLQASDSGEGDPGCFYQRDIWYEFVVPATGAIDVELISSNFNTYYRVYAGSCGSLVYHNQCQQLFPSSPKKVGGLISGNTYYLRLWNIENDEGFIEFCVSESSATVSNDACDGAIDITLGDDICGPTNSCNWNIATLNEPDNCLFSEFRKDIYYKFEAPPSGEIIVSILSYNFLSINGGGYFLGEGSCGNITLLQCVNVNNNSQDNFITGLVPGNIYYFVAIAIDPTDVMDFCINAVPVPPSNDLCGGALMLIPSVDQNCNNQISSSTYGGKDNISDCGAGTEEVFYQFVSDDNQNYTIEISNETNSVQLAVFSGSCTNQLVACGGSILTIPTVSGETYTLAISTVDPTQFADFDLCVYPYDNTLSQGNVGIDIQNPIQQLQLTEAIMIGNTSVDAPGSIRFTGVDFEGNTGSGWTSMTATVTNDNLGNHVASQSLNMNGNVISNLGAASSPGDATSKSYVDNHTDGDASSTNEIQGLSKSGSTVTLSLGGGSFIDEVNDADNDPTNEIETWSTLSGVPAGFADNIDHIDDADNDPTNEIETWSTLSGIPVGFADGIDDVDDADADVTNELIISMSLFNDLLKINEYSNTFTADFASYNNGWVKDMNDDLSYNLGGVLIGGTGTPSEHLDIQNGGIYIERNSVGTDPHIELKEDHLADGARINFTNTNSTNTWTLYGRAHDVESSNRFNVYSSSGGNIMTFNAGGKVGINDSTPSAGLDINAPAGENGLTVRLNGSTKFDIDDDGGISIGSLNSNVPANVTYIDNALGVDIDDPNYTLVAQGRISAAWEQAQTNHMDIGHGGVNGFLNASGGNMDFRHNDVTYMTLVDNGHLLLGTATDNASRLINTGSGAYLTTGGTWTNASSRSLKENFTSASGDEILSKLMGLNILYWNYKDSNEGVHLGPIAEDFHKAFGLSNNDKSISTVDADGVALAAIQALAKENEALKKRMDQQDRIIAELIMKLEKK